MQIQNPFRFADPWDPSHRFETSWLLPPWALFACRALISLYCFITQIYNLAHAGSRAARLEFSYFTVLTYWGIAFYTLFAAIHTFTYIKRASHRPLLADFPPILRALHSLLYSTIVVFPIIVTAVYWAILFDPAIGFPDTHAVWTNTSRHAMNTGFAAFEILIPRTNPMPWIHILWNILMLAGYLGVAYITHETEGCYTYAFLDPKNGSKLLAGYIVGIAAGSAVLFAIIWGIVWLRKWVTEEKLGFKGKFVRDGNGNPADGRKRVVVNSERAEVKGSDELRGSNGSEA